MPSIPAPWKTVAAYGLLAAVLLACLYVIALAPLSLDWGRELVGAAIAIVALGVGLHLAQRRRSPPPLSTQGDATPQDATPEAPLLAHASGRCSNCWPTA